MLDFADITLQNETQTSQMFEMCMKAHIEFFLQMFFANQAIRATSYIGKRLMEMNSWEVNVNPALHKTYAVGCQKVLFSSSPDI